MGSANSKKDNFVTGRNVVLRNHNKKPLIFMELSQETQDSVHQTQNSVPKTQLSQKTVPKVINTIIYSCGASYEGYLENKKYNGFGTYISNNKKDDFLKYSGEWKNNLPNGKGEIVYKNGDKYDGNWEKGLYEGEGKYYYSNGNVFESKFKEGMFHGESKLIKPNFAFIICKWYYGRFVKIIKIVYNNKDEYEAELDGLDKHGKGKYVYHNGDYYEGEWKSNKKNGWGKYIYKNGKIISGDWKDNKLVKIYDKECKICCEKKNLVVLAPCGHRHFCNECVLELKKLNKYECPLCKTNIESIVNTIYQ